MFLQAATRIRSLFRGAFRIPKGKIRTKIHGKTVDIDLDDFKCPVSQGFFMNPVLAADGYIYEKSYLLGMIAAFPSKHIIISVAAGKTTQDVEDYFSRIREVASRK